MFFRAFAALSALIFCLMALLFLPDIGAQAARDALALCAQTVIPSLFPFFVLSSLLVSCGAADTLSHLLSPLMRPLFGLSGTGAAALGLGLCGGYPVGARTAAALADLGLLNGKTDGGTAHYYVSDTPDNFAELEQMFLGEYAGGPVERIAIETY